MTSRRSAIRTIAYSAGALAVCQSAVRAQAPAPAPGPAGAPPPAPPAMEGEGVFKLPPLGYDYDALEPFIDAETMKIHHQKNHSASLSKLNVAIPGGRGRETT